MAGGSPSVTWTAERLSQYKYYCFVRLISPPYSKTIEEVSGWTDKQLFSFFSIQRDEEGRPEFEREQSVSNPRRSYFRLLARFGIVDPEQRERLWQEHQEKLRIEAPPGSPLWRQERRKEINRQQVERLIAENEARVTKIIREE